MSEQVGWRGLVERIRQEAPYWSTILPQLPRLLHQALAAQARPHPEAEAARLREERRRNRLLAVIAALLAVIGVALLL
jgi:ubiquinone biosynthesis protein